MREHDALLLLRCKALTGVSKMAKAILLRVLESYLGRYISGITADNLKMGVWSGKVELQNLELRPSALADLKLPVKVRHGTIGKLTAVVPWRHLGSKPVQITMDEVFVLAVPCIQ